MKRLLIFLLAALPALAAGTVTQSNQQIGSNNVIVFSWTADTNGSVPATRANFGTLGNVQGQRILLVETVPGSPAPTNGYSVQLQDFYGGDMMAGAMAAVSSTAVQNFAASSAVPPINGSFSLVIAGQSVSGAKGTVIVYFGNTTLVNASAGSPGPAGPAGPSGPAGAAAGGLASTAFAFTQTPGGTLTAAVGASVTLTPCPAGVSGADTGHWLYVSAGVGTAEPVLITGGTCTSGATTGTVIFTPANNHSGAWTIQSNSAGIAEACFSAPSPYVVIPAGDYNIFGSIRPAKGCTIDGLGTTGNVSGAVNLHQQIAALPLFDLAANAITIKNLQLSYGTSPGFTVNGVAATAGSIGIQSGVTASVDQPVILNVISNNFFINYNFFAGAIYCDHVSSLTAVSHGFQLGALGSGFMLNVFAQLSGGDGFHIKTGSAALQWENVSGFVNKGWSLFVEDNAAFQMDDLDFENDSLGGISVGVTAVNSILQNIIIQGEGNNPFAALNTTAPGIQIRSSGFLIVSNAQVASSQGNGVEILAGVGANIGGSDIYQNGLGAQAGHTFNISSLGSGTFHGLHTYLSPVLINGNNNRLVGNYFNFTTCAVTAGVQFGASATHTVFAENDVDCGGGGGVAISYTGGSTFKAASNHVSLSTTITGTPVSDLQTVYTYQLAQLPAPSTLTVAANAITVSLPIHHVGAGLIKTINMASAFPVCVDLIADAAFTTDTTGNITTPAITATAGKVYHFCFDGGTAKWYGTN